MIKIRKFKALALKLALMKFVILFFKHFYFKNTTLNLSSCRLGIGNDRLQFNMFPKIWGTCYQVPEKHWGTGTGTRIPENISILGNREQVFLKRFQENCNRNRCA